MNADAAYENSPRIPQGDQYPARWARAAAEYRASLGARARLDLAYGPGERHKLDLFMPEGAPRGLVVFVHGGYWLAYGRETWSHLAAGVVARGWACALPSYTLAPGARISEMTREVLRAVESAAELVPGPVVVTGHSAGGQLSARMGCADLSPKADLRRVVPISPLADLEPLRETTMNQKLRINAAEAAAESPARLALRPGVSAHVWVGAQERPAFLWQARLLSEAWDCRWTPAPGRHHFDVVEPLCGADSTLTAACLSL